MNSTERMLGLASKADEQATHELDSTTPEFQHAAVWAQLATARSIAALATATQAIADAMNFHALS
jgi:hypothetical protein